MSAIRVIFFKKKGGITRLLNKTINDYLLTVTLEVTALEPDLMLIR